MRDRTKRWGSMWELGRALAGWLYEQGVTADVTSRSIKDGWLDPRSPSEQAPSPIPFGSDGPRRRVFSTIKRRVADTLAGETVSTLIAQHRVPTRLLGWTAAATGLTAILWSLVIQGGASAPVPDAAGEAPAPAAALAPAAPVLPSSVSPNAPAATLPAEPVSASTSAALVRPSPVPERKPLGTPKPLAVAKPIAPPRAHFAEPAAKAARSPTATARPRLAGPTTRRGIDQEFGF
jgi:hypothetical protein